MFRNGIAAASGDAGPRSARPGSRSRFLLVALTSRAEPENLMLVPFDLETDAARFLFLQRFDLVGTEFEDRTATTADEVVVVTPIQFSFEPRLPLKHESLREPRTLEKL